MKRFIKDMRRYLPYTKYAAKSGLKSEVATSHLSWLWWILDPVLFMLVYWFIFHGDLRPERRSISISLCSWACPCGICSARRFPEA